MARGRAIHAEAEAKKMARRSQVLAEWKKYSLPPLDDKVYTAIHVHMNGHFPLNTTHACRHASL